MQENDIEIYSTHNEFIVSERVIRMLRIKNYEYVNSLLQDVYNDKDLKFKVGDYVRISIYKNISGKGYTTKWSKTDFWIKNVEGTLPWTYEIENGQ